MSKPSARDTPYGGSVRAEYLRRAKEVADAVARSEKMERDFLEKKVLNHEANEACAESLHKRRELAAWLMAHHAELFAIPEPVRGEAGDWIDAVVLDICEIPDRTSPEDEPEIMLVKADELRRIILANLPEQRP